MIAGMSTACFYPEYTEQAFKKICSNNVKAVEIFFNCGAELDKKYLEELKKIADASGTKIISIHPYTSAQETFYFFTNYKRRFNEGAEIYKKYYEAANLLGVDIVVFHGAVKHINIQKQQYFENYSLLVNDAKKYGCSLSHENVVRCMSGNPQFLSELVGYLPEVKFVLDTKQAYRANADILGLVNILGRSINHIHISDYDLDYDCLPPGKGTFNIKEFLLVMHKIGYNGGVIVETYRENFDEDVEIFRGYQHLSTLISTILQY